MASALRSHSYSPTLWPLRKVSQSPLPPAGIPHSLTYYYCLDSLNAWCTTHSPGADLPGKRGKKTPSIQLLCFQTWICSLENLRLTERHLTTAWVQLRSETLGCISTVLANMRAHIQWGIKFLLHSCWTEIILNKPSKTDSDSSTAGIAQENFISARGKILPLYYCYRLHHLDLSSF